MNRTDGDRKELVDWSSDRDVWRRSCLIDAPEDEVARLLDLAAFADGFLQPDERDRVAALLAEDFAGSRRCRGGPSTPRCVSVGRSRRAVARACALAPDELNLRVVAFVPPSPRRHIFHGLAQWGSLAAAIVLASWAGLCHGSDMSRTLRGPLPSNEANFLPELFEPGRRSSARSLVRLRGRDSCVDGGARHHAASSFMGSVDAILGAEFVLCRRGIVDPLSGACAPASPAERLERVGAELAFDPHQKAGI